LRENRGQNQELREEFVSLKDEVKRGFDRIDRRMDGMKDAIATESILGRYAAKEVEERLVAIEERVSLLEQNR
jgi:hypothetical protein